MSESDAAPAASSAASWLTAALAAAAVAVSGLALAAAGSAREAAEGARTEAIAASRAADLARKAGEQAAKDLAGLRSDFEMLAVNVDAVQRNIKELADAVNFGPGGGGLLGGGDPGAMAGPPAQPVLEFTPELREVLRKTVAAKGMVLGEDRVSIPGTVILREGALEYFAIFPGGRAHESIFLLTGKPGEEGARVEGLGASLNACLMALGLKPGTPLKLLPGRKPVPAKGETVHVSVEWEEEGKAVRVRAEDLLWDHQNNRAMEPGKFIYVGSYFVPDEGYVPDLTGDAIAVYSVASCVIDLDDERAASDTVFLPCTPRIPPEGTAVRLVFSPKPLEPTRTWDPSEPAKRTDGGAGGK